MDVNTDGADAGEPVDGELTRDNDPWFEVSGALHNSGADEDKAKVAIYVDGQPAGRDT